MVIDTKLRFLDSEQQIYLKSLSLNLKLNNSSVITFFIYSEIHTHKFPIKILVRNEMYSRSIEQSEMGCKVAFSFVCEKCNKLTSQKILSLNKNKIMDL